MASWFSQVQKGRLETELLDLNLKSDHHGEFSGQGFLSWDRNNGIEICALTDGGERLTQRIWSGAQQLQIGCLIPPEWYLRLNATARSGDSIEVDRLCFDGYDVYSSHECVAWRLEKAHVRSAADFSGGARLEKADSVSILFANGHGLPWPRRSASDQGCLQASTRLGEVVAYEILNGDVLVQLELPSPHDVHLTINTVCMAFCFWSGRLLDVVGYEARQDDATRCRVFPTPPTRTITSVAPPPGHMFSRALEAHHEELLKHAVNFFMVSENQTLGTLLQANVSCPDVSFSLGILISCSVLEGIAKQIAKCSQANVAISAAQKSGVEAFLHSSQYPLELIQRFQGFMGRMNAPTGANALSEWCRTRFLDFTGEDWEAWDFRNRSAHGNLSLYGDDFEDRKNSVAKRDRIHNMINKLVLHVIGYRGKYFDYATHQAQDFPPQLPTN